MPISSMIGVGQKFFRSQVAEASHILTGMGSRFPGLSGRFSSLNSKVGLFVESQALEFDHAIGDIKQSLPELPKVTVRTFGSDNGSSINVMMMAGGGGSGERAIISPIQLGLELKLEPPKGVHITPAATTELFENILIPLREALHQRALLVSSKMEKDKNYSIFMKGSYSNPDHVAKDKAFYLTIAETIFESLFSDINQQKGDIIEFSSDRFFDLLGKNLNENVFRKGPDNGKAITKCLREVLLCQKGNYQKTDFSMCLSAWIRNNVVSAREIIKLESKNIVPGTTSEIEIKPSLRDEEFDNNVPRLLDFLLKPLDEAKDIDITNLRTNLNLGLNNLIRWLKMKNLERSFYISFAFEKNAGLKIILTCDPSLSTGNDETKISGLISCTKPKLSDETYNKKIRQYQNEGELQNMAQAFRVLQKDLNFQININKVGQQYGIIFQQEKLEFEQKLDVSNAYRIFVVDDNIHHRIFHNKYITEALGKGNRDKGNYIICEVSSPEEFIKLAMNDLIQQERKLETPNLYSAKSKTTLPTSDLPHIVVLDLVMPWGGSSMEPFMRDYERLINRHLRWGAKVADYLEGRVTGGSGNIAGLTLLYVIKDILPCKVIVCSGYIGPNDESIFETPKVVVQGKSLDELNIPGNIIKSLFAEGENGNLILKETDEEKLTNILLELLDDEKLNMDQLSKLSECLQRAIAKETKEGICKVLAWEDKGSYGPIKKTAGIIASQFNEFAKSNGLQLQEEKDEIKPDEKPKEGQEILKKFRGIGAGRFFPEITIYSEAVTLMHERIKGLLSKWVNRPVEFYFQPFIEGLGNFINELEQNKKDFFEFIEESSQNDRNTDRIQEAKESCGEGDNILLDANNDIMLTSGDAKQKIEEMLRKINQSIAKVKTTFEEDQEMLKNGTTIKTVAKGENEIKVKIKDISQGLPAFEKAINICTNTILVIDAELIALYKQLKNKRGELKLNADPVSSKRSSQILTALYQIREIIQNSSDFFGKELEIGKEKFLLKTEMKGDGLQILDPFLDKTKSDFE